MLHKARAGQGWIDKNPIVAISIGLVALYFVVALITYLVPSLQEGNLWVDAAVAMPAVILFWGPILLLGVFALLLAAMALVAVARAVWRLLRKRRSV